jgi:hypothetical protein
MGGAAPCSDVVAGLDPATHVVAARIGINRADNAKQPELEHDPEKCAAVFEKIMLNQRPKAR